MAKHHIENGLVFREYGDGLRLIGFSDKEDKRTRLSIPEFVFLSHSRSIEKRQVTEIAKNAFENNTRLQIIELPHSVRVIDSDAFYNCPNLQVITSITGEWKDNSINIMKRAFACCTQLRIVDLHRPIYWLCEESFAFCPSLNKFTCPILDVAKNAFTPCRLESLTFYPKCRIHTDSIENSGVKELIFQGEIEYTPQKTMRWIKKAPIKICCSITSSLQDLIYEGVCVETYKSF